MYHAQELVGLEALAAHKRAVDVRLGHKLVYVIGLHGTAVKHAHGFGVGLAVNALHLFAHENMGVLRLVGCGGLAGADGPDGLVGYYDLRGLGGGDAGESAVKLGFKNAVSLLALALLEGFADAEYGHDIGLYRGLHLFVHHLVGLEEDLAALGMADDSVGAASVYYLGRGDGPGESAFLLPGHVLRGKENFGTGQRGLYGVQAGKTRGEEDFMLKIRIEPFLYGGGEVRGLFRGQMHLPVPSYHRYPFIRSHFRFSLNNKINYTNNNRQIISLNSSWRGWGMTTFSTSRPFLATTAAPAATAVSAAATEPVRVTKALPPRAMARRISRSFTGAAFTAASAASTRAETEKASIMPRASSPSTTVVPEMAGKTSGWIFGITKLSTSACAALEAPASTAALTSPTSPATRAIYLPGQIERDRISFILEVFSMASAASMPFATLESSTPPIAFSIMTLKRLSPRIFH